tara:strand:- start:1240 stop:1422 length:183 start_codon:yes stop_codon:yes gene_type:complete
MSSQDNIDFFSATALCLTAALAGAFFGAKSAIDDVQAQTQEEGQYEDHWYEFRSPGVSGE